MKKKYGQATLDRKLYSDEAKVDAEKRGSMMLSSPSFLNDDDWGKAQLIARKQGPLSLGEMARFKIEHDSFARAHFLDLVFECERLYSIINNMAVNDDNKKEADCEGRGE
ncbi:MAG: hypothetical protein AAB973_02195 [Patescibacteria group bacterium]